MRAFHFLVLGALLVFIGSGCGVAFAHGEAADKPFIKDMTTAFYDVQITPTKVQVGDQVTVTGKVQLLTTWPYTLPSPDVAYVNMVIPGPQFALIDRTVNGQEATGSILTRKGAVYDFKMTLVAREPGRWHVHPGFAVQNVGTLIGPGEWIEVAPSAAGFHLPVQIATTGKTVDVETLGARFVWWWAVLGLIPGLIWMVYWTVPKRTVTRLAVNAQILPSDDGRDIGLVTAADHRWCDWLAAITLVILVVGWVWYGNRYPVRIPQQTDWFVPLPPPAEPHLADALATNTTYKEPNPSQPGTFALTVQVKNVGTSPIKVTRFVMAMATFLPTDAASVMGPPDFVQKALTVDPAAPIAPGETKTVTLTAVSTIFATERLIPLNDPQKEIAGLVTVQNAEGQSQNITIRSPIEAQFGTGYSF